MTWAAVTEAPLQITTEHIL